MRPLATDDALVMMRLPTPKPRKGARPDVRGGEPIGPCGPTTASVANVPRDRERTTTISRVVSSDFNGLRCHSEPFPAAEAPVAQPPMSSDWQVFLSEKQYQTVARSLEKYRCLSSDHPSTGRLAAAANAKRSYRTDPV